MPILAGTRLGPYEILAQIGAGGMGEVYRARDTRLGREVAVKVLPAALSTDPERLKRFEIEARAASALNHPGILTIHDFGSQKGAPYVVSELLDGETLRQRLVGGPLSVRDVVDFGTQIARGLAAAHDKGIVHRDLKPENLFLLPDGRVKILDFGLAKLMRPEPDPGSATEAPTVTHGTETGVVMGTVGYMSPEQLRADSVDHRSDIFALGVILYEMLSGQRPFQRGSAAETMSAILKEEPPDLSSAAGGIPAALERTVRHCLEKSPPARFQSARDIAFALAEAGAGREAPGVTLAPAAAPGLSARRPRLRFQVGAAAILVTVLLVVLVGRIVQRAPGGSTTPGRIQSIAVLPLDNFSKEAEQDYFAEGLTEALTTDLAQIRSLRVISRNSVMGYKGTKKSAREIGRELTVDGLLEGSVQKTGQRVRISAQLVEAAADRNVWARTYEGDVKDLLSLQSQVAQAVADELSAKLTPEEKSRLSRKRTVDPAAHDLYLKGTYELWNASDMMGAMRAEELFEQAIQKDPGYALAYSGVADVYLGLADLHEAPNRVMPRAREAAKRALELDPELVYAHVQLARISLLYDWDWPAGEREARRALELNPNSTDAHHMLGWYFQIVGRREESRAEFERAAKLDPLNAEVYVTSAWGEYTGRQWDRAIEAAREALKVEPRAGWVREILALSEVRLGRCGDAVAEAKKGAEVSRSPLVLAVSGGVYASCGQPEAARAVLSKVTEMSRTQYVCPYEVGVIHVGLAEMDDAFRWLNKGLEVRSECMPYTSVDPRLDPLRSDRRYEELVRRIGPAAVPSSPQAWLRANPPDG